MKMRSHDFDAIIRNLNEATCTVGTRKQTVPGGHNEGERANVLEPKRPGFEPHLIAV